MDEQLVDPHLPILEPNIGDLIFDLQCHRGVLEVLVADDLEVMEGVDQEFPIGDTGDALVVESPCRSHVRDLVLSLQIQDAGQVAAIRIPLNANQRGDIDRLPVLDPLLVDVPDAHGAVGRQRPEESELVTGLV